ATRRERRVARDPDVEIFAADRPVVGQRIFDAAANGPARAPVGLKNTGRKRASASGTRKYLGSGNSRIVEAEFRAVELHPSGAAGCVEQPFVDGVSQSGARSGVPALLYRPDEAGRDDRAARKDYRPGAVGRCEGLAFL